MSDTHDPLESSESNVERSHRIRDMLREADRVNWIIEAALDLARPVKVGDTIQVRVPVASVERTDPRDILAQLATRYELVTITPELWARIEARR